MSFKIATLLIGLSDCFIAQVFKRLSFSIIIIFVATFWVVFTWGNACERDVSVCSGTSVDIRGVNFWGRLTEGESLDRRPTYVKKTESLTFLNVVVTSSNGQQKVYTLKNPPGNIRDYFTNVEKNPWVINQLKGKLAFGDTIEVSSDGYGLKSDTPVYADRDAKEQIGTAGSAARVGVREGEGLCRYTSRPTVVTTKTCGTFCTSGIECDISGIKYTSHVFCKALKGGGGCPSASRCAESDPDIPNREEAINYDKFGNRVVPAESLEGSGSGRSAGGSSGSDSTGGNTSGSTGSSGSLK